MPHTPHIHESHPAIIARLKKAQGHLAKVIEMMEQSRSCNDIAQQLHAVEKSITNAKKVLITDHIDHCMDNILESKDPANTLAGFKEITKYL